MTAPSINTSSPVTNFSNPANTTTEILSLTDQVKWGSSGVGTGATVYYSFPISSSSSFWNQVYTADANSEINQNFTPLSTAQQTAAEQALQSWANVANLNFIKVTSETSNSVGDIRFANTSGGSMDSLTYAYASFPALNNPEGGDIWFNVTQPTASANDYSVGANGYQTMIHEIGHALGLDHPFEGTTTLSATLDHMQYTVMSYSDSPNNQDAGSSTYYPTTPMLLDIQAIQFLYGANTSYQTGNNTYTYGDTYTYETIWDAGGFDTIQYTGSMDGIINLNAGQFSSLGPSVKAHLGVSANAQNNIAIAYDVIIENAIGGTGNDTIYGNSSSNSIDGGGGNDTFITTQNKSELTSIISHTNGQLLLSSFSQQEALTNVESITFADGTFTLASLLSEASSAPIFNSQVNSANTTITPDTYTGPVDYLQFQQIGSNQNEIMTAANTNDFLNLLGGDDAANGGGGRDVLDGGTGSNFLTGGSGIDTFFIDGRSGINTWSTITDFDGDSVNIWGWIEGTSQLLLQQTDGTDGYKGETLHLDLDGDNTIDTSITFTGLSASEVANQQAAQVESNGYLLISAS